jgi:hypothetical protein
MKESAIQAIAGDYKIFVDTCAFMHPKAHTFFNNTLIPHLDNNPLLVHESVLYQLEKLSKYGSKNETDQRKIDDTKQLASNGRKIFNDLEKEGYAQRFKTGKNDRAADNIFVFIFTQKRLQHKLCLITVDNGLSTEIVNLNSSESSEFDKSGNRLIKGIKVLRIDYRGRPYLFTVPKPFKKSRKHFDLQQSEILSTTVIPTAEDFVLDESGNKYKLQEKINKGEGGEGIIYSIYKDARIVCKVFKKDRITNLKIKKLKLMVSNKIYIKSVCWPRSILYNSYEEPIGYLMKKAGKYNDIPKELSSIIGKDQVHENFPKFKTVDLVDVALKILRIIDELHSYNVIVGDIKPANILITPKSYIYFVDTDSFQIENYPCPVGEAEYTPPNRQGIPYEEYLRTLDDECFAVATLLFNIFMLRLFPYSYKGGSSAQENIKKAYFPYALGGKETGKELPLGLETWPKLPYYLQEGFFDFFSNKNTMDIDDWIFILDRYNKDWIKMKG